MVVFTIQSKLANLEGYFIEIKDKISRKIDTLRTLIKLVFSVNSADKKDLHVRMTNSVKVGKVFGKYEMPYCLICN